MGLSFGDLKILLTILSGLKIFHINKNKYS